MEKYLQGTIDISVENNNDFIYIIIEDNGVGGVNEKQNSYGLLGVRERLAEIGALIDIKSQSTGSTILISI